MRSRTRLTGALTVGALTLALAACGDDESDAAQPESVASHPVLDWTSEGPGEPTDPPPPDLDLALSEPREDSYYPEVGDPGVDALHYDLDLAWNPDTLTLAATETLTFRSTETAEEFQLDFGEPLAIAELSVDGEAASYEKVGKDLVVSHPVEADQRYELQLSYAGQPEPVEVPTARLDFSTTGWTTTVDGETWTMQEPWGAYSWYAVNDQPADKALYDFTMRVPSPWTGVANGELIERTDADGVTTTRWHLAEPAASYLVTSAFGDFEMTEDVSSTGVPITYWTPREDPSFVADLSVTPEAMAWLEELLGPYPFDTFGTVVVDSESGMETQTMVTLGDTAYTTSPEVIVHELAHQWYGDQVTPTDWRDLWMNEGMAMYLQGMWEAEQEGISIEQKMDDWALSESGYREDAGPPGAYSPEHFGSSNVYYGPALMYQELREKIGDQAFFDLVRAWPEANQNGSATREEFLAFIEEHTGEELTAFFDAWLLGETTPPRD